MKNLKISAKIILGYGVIILMSLVFAIFVIFSSITTVRNVKRIHSYSQLQTLTKDFMIQFYEARANARTIYIKNDDAAYDNVVSNLDESQKQADEIRNYIDTNGSLAHFKDKAEEALSMVNEWQLKVDQVQDANKAVDRIVEAANESRLALVDKSMGIFNYQLELSRDEASQKLDIDYKLRRVDRLEFGAKLAQNIESIGSSFELILKSYDLSRVPESKALLEETVTELDGFVKDSTLEYNIKTGTAVLKALDAYQKDIDSFIETYNQRESFIEDSRSTGEQALNAINVFLDDIDAATESLVGTTSNTASVSLIAVIVISIVSLVFAIVFALILSKMISRPIKTMHGVIEQVGVNGDLEFSDQTMRELNVDARAKDEIGQSMRSFITLIEQLSNTGKQLSRVAKGDLTIDVRLLSVKDTIGNALARMTENLNQMFHEIHAATDQVASGSKQMADGAQILAQASTEQAATVEQLSSSISELAQRTRENAEMAGRAAVLADTIKQNAERGNRQMDDMMEAVKEINVSSQNINKVIKLIDDIAFQTNLLALNAAVEAARAGQHGKGFAVVAEEVRSLAAKSAEAAKDTGTLIAGSIEKAELGARIADETAASLEEIVSGINESSKLIGDIAKLSEEQSLGITEINKGIDQVSQVVQQNSATAEESAASSEEMSEQSEKLGELISRFQIKESTTSYDGLTHMDQAVAKQSLLPGDGLQGTNNDAFDAGKY